MKGPAPYASQNPTRSRFLRWWIPLYTFCFEIPEVCLKSSVSLEPPISQLFQQLRIADFIWEKNCHPWFVDFPSPLYQYIFPSSLGNCNFAESQMQKSERRYYFCSFGLIVTLFLIIYLCCGEERLYYKNVGCYLISGIYDSWPQTPLARAVLHLTNPVYRTCRRGYKVNSYKKGPMRNVYETKITNLKV